jgi:hypothetical protein
MTPHTDNYEELSAAQIEQDLLHRSARRKEELIVGCEPPKKFTASFFEPVEPGSLRGETSLAAVGNTERGAMIALLRKDDRLGYSSIPL